MELLFLFVTTTHFFPNQFSVASFVNYKKNICLYWKLTNSYKTDRELEYQGDRTPPLPVSYHTHLLLIFTCIPRLQVPAACISHTLTLVSRSIFSRQGASLLEVWSAKPPRLSGEEWRAICSQLVRCSAKTLKIRQSKDTQFKSL